MRVVAVQLDTAWEDKPSNHVAVERLLAAAPPPPGALVVLPEMFATGFSMDVGAINEDEHPASEVFVSELARRHSVAVVAGVVRREPGGRGLNQALAVGPEGAELVRYSKIHPFSYAGEDRHYARGRDVVTFAHGCFTVCPFVCYDLRFPEVFRVGVRKGAQLFVVIANWPSAREAHWRALLAARAIENQAWVVGVNRCGRDPVGAYPGSSRILDPLGRVVAEAGADECTLAAELDLDMLVEYRRRFPVLRDIDPRFVRE
jgi:predicted amidohydrolase